MLHAVLLRHREWFGVNDIAKQARVSPATASQVLMEMEKFEWVVSRGQGPGKERHLQEPGALLDAWVNQQAVMRPLSMRRYFVPSARAEGLVEKFAEVCAESKAEYGDHSRGGRATVRAISVNCLPGALPAAGRPGSRSGSSRNGCLDSWIKARTLRSSRSSRRASCCS